MRSQSAASCVCHKGMFPGKCIKADTLHLQAHQIKKGLKVDLQALAVLHQHVPIQLDTLCGDHQVVVLPAVTRCNGMCEINADVDTKHRIIGGILGNGVLIHTDLDGVIIVEGGFSTTGGGSRQGLLLNVEVCQ
eukprot:295442-Rhodomonas_salina.1